MTPYTIYKLTFTAPLHLSRGKANTYESSDTMLHSDTLKAALYAAALQVGLQAWADVFMHETRLSSAFPFQGATLYLPMPLSYHPTIEAKDRKAFKAIKYLTIKQFEAVANQETITLLDAEGKAEQPTIWKRDTTQRVYINYEGDSEPFYLEKLYPVSVENGLYFMVSDNTDFTTFEKVLNVLADNGIGLQRNLGNGRFKWQKETLSMNLPTQPTAYLNLSLYHPNQADLNDGQVLEKSVYQFKKRGGWVSSPEIEKNISLRKKAIMMFTEGSVFTFQGAENKGVVKDVRPDTAMISHEIWRDGKPIFLPIKA
jgi:CRISPR-associated protein Csm4